MSYFENTDMSRTDRIKGCLIGGASGDALGYAVEFLPLSVIREKYGENGITQYSLDPASGKALISDDTQMTLFTANGLLRAYRSDRRLDHGDCFYHIFLAYQDWMKTQEPSFRGLYGPTCWLMDEPRLHARRAPGNTCLSALGSGLIGTFEDPLNDSKGCGGVMRVAPIGLALRGDTDEIDYAGARVAAMTHGHPLGYLPAAVLTHILHGLTHGYEGSYRELVQEASKRVMLKNLSNDHVRTLVEILRLADTLAFNHDTDETNIRRLGEGWVAEEALAIAVYCSLRYEDDFSAAICAAVNHDGDSDSTGAICGNIMGAIHGLSGIDAKWTKDLELYDVIWEIAKDLAYISSPFLSTFFCHGTHWEDKYKR